MVNNYSIEKIPFSIFENKTEASLVVANAIADFIQKRNNEDKNTVLGLATGSSPVDVYKELVRKHKEEGLSFKNVITFNLDEYYPISPLDKNSYFSFMNQNLFNHIDIKRENIHIPSGTVAETEINDFCINYEQAIEDAGGLDIQILGIGRTGHIGFNEPGSQIFSKTRKINLDIITKTDASANFNGIGSVPSQAITMGIGTILKARKIFLLAWNKNKADIIKKTIEGQMCDFIPATFLQGHDNVEFFLDKDSASELSRINYPWLFEDCKWDEQLKRKAVVWLCLQLNKPILKLTDIDYINNGMTELLHLYHSAYDLNINVFNILQHTITGWPGGKPNADDSQRPERAYPYPKRVVIFSPHPDDDVISMGGTLARLVKQGHDVHVVYQTSGNLAVFDDDLIKYVDFISNSTDILEIKDQTINVLNNIKKDITLSKDNSNNIYFLKGMIRKSEAYAACRFIGIPHDNIHFLQMPFYESGKEEKLALSKTDISLIYDLLQNIRPHQIYAAGDLADPHGTHKVCFDAIIQAINMLKGEKWLDDCYLWMYRGAWQEWELHEVDMAIPLSPDEVTVKRKAIFKHQTQKDVMPFPGSDSREFWQRAEERNHQTAILYDKIGLAEYQAIELFVRYKFTK